jgi:hypothetical protein
MSIYYLISDPLHSVELAELLPDHQLHNREGPETHPLRGETLVETLRSLRFKDLSGAVEHARVDFVFYSKDNMIQEWHLQAD